MNLKKIKDYYGGEQTVNLDMLTTIQDHGDNFALQFGGVFINVNQEEYAAIMKEIEEVKLDPTTTTNSLVNKFKNMIYSASYLDATAKLNLLQQLETIVETL